jgi:Tfp pilus assembly protein PilV
MKPPKASNGEAGVGLIEAMIAGTVGIVIMLAIAKMATSNLQSARKLDSSADRSTIKINIANGVDCATTLPAPVTCPVGNTIALRGRDGTEIVAAGGTLYGKWTVVARCAANGIDVRAAALSPAGAGTAAALAFNAANDAWFARDEVQRNLAYNWNHPKAALFPPGPNGLCNHLFGGGQLITQCAANQYVSGIDFANRALVCENIPQCPANEASSWTGSGFVCVPARTDTYINGNLIQPAITNNNNTISTTPFVCDTGTRTGGGGLSGGSGAMSEYNASGGKNWGMYCTGAYTKTGCTIANSSSADGSTSGGQYADWDIWPLTNGCYTDDEEKANSAVLSLTCCRNGNLP